MYIYIIAYVYAYPSLIMFASKTFLHMFTEKWEGERVREGETKTNTDTPSSIYIIYACILYIVYLI